MLRAVVRFPKSLCATVRPKARLRTCNLKVIDLVDLLELCLLRLLNEKNSEKALEFPVRTFSELSNFEWLTMDEIIEFTELDHATIEPIVKKLLKQRILARRHERFTLNKHLEKINKLLV